MSSTPLIEHMTDYLDTGQNKDDAFNPKPICPELDNSEQLTGKPIQPYFSLVHQLQWQVTLGCHVIHAQIMTLPILRSTPRQLQGIYDYVKKTTITNWIHFNHYLSDM